MRGRKRGGGVVSNEVNQSDAGKTWGGKREKFPKISKILFTEFVIKETKKGATECSMCPRKFIWSDLGLVYLLFEDKNRGGFLFSTLKGERALM